MKRIFLTLAVVLLLTGRALAAPTVVGTPAIDNSNANIHTMSCDAGSSANRVLYAFVLNDGTALASLPTYNGVATTAVDSESNASAKVWLYRLINPASGSNTLSVDHTGTGTVPNVIGCIAVDGTNQTTPNDTPVKHNGSGGAITHDVTSETGDLVLDFIYAGGTSVNWQLVAGSGQTEHIDSGVAATVGGSARSWGVSAEAGAATVTMSWTPTNTTAWAHISINVNAVGGGGGGGTVRHRVIQ